MSVSSFFSSFFFSSRRRHTRLQGDWSSDVCSSDLEKEWGSNTKPVRNIFGELKTNFIAVTDINFNPLPFSFDFVLCWCTKLDRSEWKYGNSERKYNYSERHPHQNLIFMTKFWFEQKMSLLKVGVVWSSGTKSWCEFMNVILSIKYTPSGYQI